MLNEHKIASPAVRSDIIKMRDAGFDLMQEYAKAGTEKDELLFNAARFATIGVMRLSRSI